MMLEFSAGELLAACALTLILTLLLTLSTSTRAWKADAVRHGAAEWIMNPHTGDPQWRWKSPPPSTQPTQEKP